MAKKNPRGDVTQTYTLFFSLILSNGSHFRFEILEHQFSPCIIKLCSLYASAGEGHLGFRKCTIMALIVTTTSE